MLNICIWKKKMKTKSRLEPKCNIKQYWFIISGRRRITLLIHSKESTQKNDSFTIPRKEMINFRHPEPWLLQPAKKLCGFSLSSELLFWLGSASGTASVCWCCSRSARMLNGINTRDVQQCNKRTFQHRALVFELYHQSFTSRAERDGGRCWMYLIRIVSCVFRKPDIQVPYLYFDLGAAVLCASFMSFGVKRRWFSLAAALHLAISTYVSYVSGHVHYGDWLKVQTYSLISSEHKGIIFVLLKSNISVIVLCHSFFFFFQAIL